MAPTSNVFFGKQMFHSSKRIYFLKTKAQVQSHYPTDGELEVLLVPELAHGRTGEPAQAYRVS